MCIWRASAARVGTPVRTFGGAYDAFAAKLDSSGAFVWNTFLGSGGTDHGYGIAVDAGFNVYVVGFSDATWGSPVRPYSGGAAAFAAKLDSGGALVWNTFLGGGNDSGTGVAVDVTGNVYVSGSSQATWGSPVRPFAGNQDAYAAKLDPSGTLTWNTFLGSSSGADVASAIAVDGIGNVYVGGFSAATWGSPDRAFIGAYAAFAVQLDSNGSLNWNTFLGDGTLRATPSLWMEAGMFTCRAGALTPGVHRSVLTAPTAISLMLLPPSWGLRRCPHQLRIRHRRRRRRRRRRQRQRHPRHRRQPQFQRRVPLLACKEISSSATATQLSAIT